MKLIEYNEWYIRICQNNSLNLIHCKNKSRTSRTKYSEQLQFERYSISPLKQVKTALIAMIFKYQHQNTEKKNPLQK